MSQSLPTGEYRTPASIAVAVETIGTAIGQLSIQNRDEFGQEHHIAIAGAYARAESILKALLWNLVEYGNAHGVTPAGSDEGGQS